MSYFITLWKEKNMLNTVCYWLVVIGALNYGLMAFGYNFLEKLPAHIGEIVSIAIAVAAILTIITKLKKWFKKTNHHQKKLDISSSFFDV